MTLREHILASGISTIQQICAIVPNDILSMDPDSFDADCFSRLQKLLPAYLKTITYTARVEAIKEIDGFFDALFHSRFPKLCRADKCYENPEMDILLLKELQGGSDSSLYAQSQDDRADSLGISTRALQDRIRDLEDGKDILGHFVKITIDGRGRVAYDSTVHPIFLTLTSRRFIC